MTDKKAIAGISITGAAIGIIAVILVACGNPANMGFCIACFLRDIAGAVQLQNAPVVQYFRPEIVGLVLGALIVAMLTKEFHPKGGSSPVTRFFLGAFVMIGALVFLGCPLRMVLRIGGGDYNAIVGLVGFACGILVGIPFLNRGFSLKRTYTLPKSEALAFPISLVLLFALCLAVPALFIFSAEGPGSKHAPIIIALVAGLVVGALCQRSRMCMVAGIRDLVLFKDWKMIIGFVIIIVATLLSNLLTGGFKPGFSGQPVAHSLALWNFLGMLIVGLGSVLLGGCPLRQIILTGEGNTDSAVTVLGYIAGAAFAHNFKLAAAAATAEAAGGPSVNGKVAVVLGLVVMLAIALVNTAKVKSAKGAEAVHVK